MSYPAENETTLRDRDVRGMHEDPRFAGETTEAPQSEVPHALQRLERANSQLHEVVKVLHERLAPVRNQHNTQSESDKAVRGYGSEIAIKIGSEADRAELATAVIVKILNELEV